LFKQKNISINLIRITEIGEGPALFGVVPRTGENNIGDLSQDLPCLQHGFIVLVSAAFARLGHEHQSFKPLYVSMIDIVQSYIRGDANRMEIYT
jgi:hypothetical protein